MSNDETKVIGFSQRIAEIRGTKSLGFNVPQIEEVDHCDIDDRESLEQFKSELKNRNEIQTEFVKELLAPLMGTEEFWETAPSDIEIVSSVMIFQRKLGRFEVYDISSYVATVCKSKNIPDPWRYFCRVCWNKMNGTSY